jgi:hypothetical protein
MIDRLNAALKDRYTLERDVGEGGMATVYLAQDLKHNRKVALKVLKPELSAVVGAERFLSEIETTANLQHPHILPLFDSGEADGLLFYVMPYVQGETLRQRLDREKQLSIDEGVRIATAVAGALDHAHRHGVVHRDIKPANILLQDGEPVVSDFGIALAVGAGGARLTETGLSVGTPYYMSPEQATGDQLVGAAGDIYSLGCVLYEMLVGEPPYLGNSAQAVLGKIIQGQPVSATAARRSVPAHVDAAIRKALEKLPADRFTSAQDFARALADTSFRHGAGGVAGGAQDRGRWKAIAQGLAAAMVVLAAGLAWSVFGRTEPLPPMERYASPFLHDQEPDNLLLQFFGLAPDGSLLVYRSGSALWVRRWRDMEAVPVRGGAGGWTPSVSPEADAVSFWTAEREIKVASLEGGPVQTVLTGAAAFQHWGRDGFIYARVASEDSAWIVRVAAAGGAVDTLWAIPEGENHYVTDILPGGRKAAIFAAFPGNADAVPEIRFVDLETGEATTVTTGAEPHYLPTGDLVYLAPDSSLMVAPVDVGRGELTGPAVAMVQGVTAFDVARDGTLFYTGGDPTDEEFELVWVSRTGLAEPVQPGWTFDPDLDNRGWEISPDGKYIALKARTDLGNDIWVKELPEGPMTRLTYDEAADRRPTWNPDGEHVTFVSFREGGMKAWMRRADAVGEATLIPGTEGMADAVWTPDGTTLVIRSTGPTGVAGRRDISTLRVGEDSVPTPLLAEDYDEFGPAISPDGRWLAYTSDETGQFEVFVRPFPNVNEGKVQVSDGGGRGAVWSPDGREIYYVTDGPTTGEGRRFLSAALRPGPPMAVLGRRALFDVPNNFYFANYTTSVDITPDGERFLMARVANQAIPDRRRFVLVRNWLTEVAERRR